MRPAQQKLALALGVALIAAFAALIVIARSSLDKEPPTSTNTLLPSSDRGDALADSTPVQTPEQVVEHKAEPATAVPSATTDRIEREGPATVTLSGHVPVSASLEEVLALLVLPNLEPNPRAIAELARSNSPEVIERLLEFIGESDGESDSPIERAALAALGELRTPAMLPPCRQALTSDHAPLRHTALNALSKLDSAESSEALLTHLNRGQVEDQKKTLEALGSLPYPGVGPRLVGYLDHPEPELRRAAATSLVGLGDLSVLNSVIAASQHEDRFVRRQIARALTNSRAAEALPTLQRLARNDSDLRVRGNAIQGLGDFGGDDEAALLEALLEDDNEWIREQAQGALSRLR